MGDIAKDEIRERLGNIDQIRDIIFGSQIRDYDNRLGKMEADIDILQQEMRDRMEKLKTSLSAELKVAMDGIEKKIKVLNTNTDEEFIELRQQVDRLNKKFSSNIQTLDETIDAQTTSIRSELTQAKDQLQEDVSALRDLVLEELERRFVNLREAKVSRHDMAEALFELGMRLKGTEFIPTLKEASDHQGSGNESDGSYDEVPLLPTRKLQEETHAS